MFKPQNDRDAWYVIQGFVYQVDLTILKWIQLEPNQALELERGEDVDTISQIENEDVLRELGQIKHRESNITLNNPTVIEILRNYCLHIIQNPESHLLFNFITNASYGQERPAIFGGGMKGIDAWIALQNSDSEIDPSDFRYRQIKAHIVAKIKSFVKSINQIDEVSAENQQWLDFAEFVEDDNKFKGIIKNFRWSFREEDAKSLCVEIKRLLLTNGLAENDAKADLIYPRLFLHVFKTLTRKGLKRIDSKDLYVEAQLPALSSTDESMFTVLNSLLNNVVNDLSKINDHLEIHSMEILKLQSSAALNSSINAVFNHRLGSLNMTPPAPVTNGSERLLKSTEIVGYFNSLNWINFQGINACGKTQLASQVSKLFPVSYWLDLRPFSKDIHSCIAVVELFLSEISGVPTTHYRKEWLQLVSEKISTNTLIVLNDLPPYSEHVDLFSILSVLSNFSNNSIKLLTTSNIPMNVEVKSRLNAETFLEYYDFDFSQEEIEELLTNNNAPKYVIDLRPVISVVSKNNARLLNAIVQHLKRMNWGSNSKEAIEAILNRDVTYEILNNVQTSISNLIPDQQAKELLYRLSLIHWSFGIAQISAVSAIHENIIHPGERMQEILHSWVQQVSSRSYQISPLIVDIGIDNLAVDTVKKVYTAVGHSLIAERTIDPITGIRCISSFIKGGDFDNAGIVLLNIYQSTEAGSVENLNQWGFLKYWATEAIPRSMRFSLRSAIRYEQIRLFRYLSKDTAYFFDDLETMLIEPNLSQLDHSVLLLFVLGNFEGTALLKYLKLSNDFFGNWEIHEKEFKELPMLSKAIELLWSPLKNIHCEEDLRVWLNCIELAETKTKIDFFASGNSSVGINLICHQIVDHEYRKAVDQRDWNKLFNSLRFFSAYFNTRKKELLEAIVLKHRITVLYNVLDQHQLAITETTSAEELFSAQKAKYVLNENLGKLLYDKGEVEQSKVWLNKAVSLVPHNKGNYVNTLLYAAAANSSESTARSLELCLKANEISSKLRELSELDIIKVQGEMGVAYWLDGNIPKCVQVFETLLNRLTAIKDTEYGEYWIRMFMWTGHTLGYIASIADRDRPPTLGNEEYFKPFQGIYIFNTRDLSDIYKPVSDSFLYVHLALIAGSINDLDKAYEMTIKAFDLARQNADQKITLMISSTCAPFLILNFKVAETIEVQMMVAVISHYFSGDISKREQELNSLDLNEIFSNKPSKLLNDAEDTTITFAILPLFILVLNGRLLTKASASDDEFKFSEALNNYLENASDSESWRTLILLCERILSKEATADELVSLIHYFAESKKNNLRDICFIGLIYTLPPTEKTVEYILNVIPNISNIQQSMRAIIKGAIIPFVRIRCIDAIKCAYVGSRSVKDAILIKIEQIDINDKNAIQLILQETVSILELPVVDERKKWLFEFDNSVRGE